ncbi:DnaJ domain-containing protein [Radiomyces spectabilis]|uniref:DnaJ domain-containing protein n=1 Tax=Radiomyces spectabilis TaxID=64574 RepID=UPI002221249C|nr:DnaJ domain-containing protein [Radiomyces spectabilis]KAI8368111.1 DnaJ domain-containing protein [Radiomyces spectabilis]
MFELHREDVNFYEVLNSAPSSTPEQIKTEYKRLALIHHPDKSQTSESDQSSYRRIKEAYDVVGDPSRRALYDRWRNSGLQIPFSDFEKLGSHAQTVHWQTLPGKLSIAQDESSEQDIQTVKPQPSVMGHVNIERKPFWNQDDVYEKFRQYQI